VSLEDYPVVIEETVLWGEMDAFQHVNNTVYFRYFESARIAYFQAVGYLDWMRAEGSGPILASTSCRFRRPLTWPDSIQIGARVSELGEDRFTMEYAIYSQSQQTIAAIGQGVAVHFDYRGGGKQPIPGSIREAIEKLGLQS
jgi:acyl-CoA thioester hydrolase